MQFLLYVFYKLIKRASALETLNLTIIHYKSLVGTVNSLLLVSINIRNVPRLVDRFVADFRYFSFVLIGMCKIRLAQSTNFCILFLIINPFCNSLSTHGFGVKDEVIEDRELVLALPIFNVFVYLLRIFDEAFIIGNIYKINNIDSFLSKLFEDLSTRTQLDSPCCLIILRIIS